MAINKLKRRERSLDPTVAWDLPIPGVIDEYVEGRRINREQFDQIAAVAGREYSKAVDGLPVVNQAEIDEDGETALSWWENVMDMLDDCQQGDK